MACISISSVETQRSRRCESIARRLFGARKISHYFVFSDLCTTLLLNECIHLLSGQVKLHPRAAGAKWHHSFSNATWLPGTILIIEKGKDLRRCGSSHSIRFSRNNIDNGERKGSSTVRWFPFDSIVSIVRSQQKGTNSVFVSLL